MAFLHFFAGLCVISAVTSKVLTEKGCAGGPEVWCKDVATATSCGKLSYCSNFMWDDDSEWDDLFISAEKPKRKCKQCIQIMKKIIKAVPAEGEEEEIKDAVNAVCDDKFKKKDKKLCHSFVDSNVDSIVESLKNKEDAKTICTNISQC
ncbi:prosaposin-like [Protopterus annectens]|uniref:prosaposin-like n=1 Tax=Protopterus annectens TaxID=7888 RepID=UPI001CFA6C52|nr:prosaposin-like [Protopterus annectens]